MVAPRDITGQRFGRLTAVTLAAQFHGGGGRFDHGL